MSTCFFYSEKKVFIHHCPVTKNFLRSKSGQLITDESNKTFARCEVYIVIVNVRTLYLTTAQWGRYLYEITINHRMRAVITYNPREIHNFLASEKKPIFEGQKRFLRSFFWKILPLCMVSTQEERFSNQERIMMARVGYFLDLTH